METPKAGSPQGAHLISCPPHSTAPCSKTDTETQCQNSDSIKCTVLEPDCPSSRPASTAWQLCANFTKLLYQLSMATEIKIPPIEKSK